MVKFKVDRSSFLIPKSERYDYFTPQLSLFRVRQRGFYFDVGKCGDSRGTSEGKTLKKHGNLKASEHRYLLKNGIDCRQHGNRPLHCRGVGILVSGSHVTYSLYRYVNLTSYPISERLRKAV